MYSPVKGARISSDYEGGFRSTGGHSGIDFAAPLGSAAYAVQAGKVISVGWGGAYGNLVKVLHDDGTMGYYAHLSRFGVKPGTKVARGSIIGKVGSTGNSTGPHLHFEVRRNGKPVNPMPWLQGGGGKKGGSLAKGKQGGSLAPTVGKQAGAPIGFQLPDVVQYSNPNDVLAQLSSQGMRAGAGKAAGGFVTSALDEAAGLSERGGTTSLRGILAREAELSNANRMMVDLAEQTAPEAPQVVSGPAVSNGGNGDFDKLFGAIRGKESGGNYKARNRHSGALGAYQIMPGNIASWSKAALGYSVSQSQFLNSRQIQDQIARHRLNMYYRKYGAAGAALAWYAGEGALKYSDSAKNRNQGQYPSMNSYVRDILRRAGLS